MHAVPQTAGDHTVSWDGLVSRPEDKWDPANRNGSPPAHGTYKWRMLATPGLKAHFLLNVGDNYPIGSDKTASGGVGSHIAPAGRRK